MIIKADGVYNFTTQQPRPFEIVEGESPNSIRVNYGKCFYEKSWQEPDWEEGGDFDTDKIISGSETLSILVKYDPQAHKITKVTIGWDQEAQLHPITVVELVQDLSGATVGDDPPAYTYSIEETPDPDEGEMLFDIATVTVSDEGIEVEQFIDYNIIIPPRVGLVYEFINTDAPV